MPVPPRKLLLSLLLVALVAAAVLLLRSPREPGVAAPDPGEVSGTEDRSGAWVTYSDPVMATVLTVTVPEESGSRDHAEAVFEVFREVDREMSEWKEDSPLTAVNRAAGGDPVPVPDELFDLLERSVEIAEVTGGAFDPTWAALWGLWDFRAAEPRVPPEEEVAARAALVDYRRLAIERPEDGGRGTVRLPRPGMALGLGGIAKGYALERSAQVLRGRGLGDFLLVAGGQVLAAGSKGDRPWRVGIRDPRGGPEDLLATLAVRDLSLSTTGDYERYFVQDGVRYHHVLDPRTGWPTRGLRSVTVVAADPVLADALSTALMVMGRDRGLALVEGMEGVEVVLVDGEGELIATAALRSRLEPVEGLRSPSSGG